MIVVYFYITLAKSCEPDMAEPRREPPIRDYEIGITLSSRFETFSVVAIFVPLSYLSYMARPDLCPRTSML